MRHVMWMALFASLTALVFGVVAKGSDRQRVIYGFKVFGEFMVIAFLLGWILYFLPLH
jgi:hypothetical protein